MHAGHYLTNARLMLLRRMQDVYLTVAEEGTEVFQPGSGGIIGTDVG